MLFIDVDGLKAINDGLGHAAGDRVLVGVANVLRNSVRATDVVGRVGGDEFAAVLAGQSGPDAAELCLRVQLEMQSLGSIDRSISVSIGVATLRGDGAETLDGLIDIADRCMYAVKRERATSRGASRRA